MVTIEVSGVCERDVDLLLLEELFASRPFFEWFLGRVGISPSAELIAVARSVTTSNGESDLELTVRLDDAIHKVLIENKIDSIFQPRQADRYCERAAGYLRDGVCSAAVTVIVAPTDYFPDEEETFGFDLRLTLEDILSWFQNAAELGARGDYKRYLLERAIARGGAGWQLVPNETVTEFWRRYWELAKSLAPDLQMPRPANKPTRSGFILFKPVGLPAGVKLLHKVRYGNVDLQSARMGERLADLENRYGHLLAPDMRIEQAGKSAVVRISVALIDMGAPFDECEPAVREGLRASLELLRWYRSATR